MIVPLLRDEAFLTDLTTPGELRLWWLGQSGFLVRYDGEFLLFDPYLSDSLTQKYAQTDKPHARMTERVIAPEQLTDLSVITSSHNHTDHLDAETLRPLFANNPDARFVIPEANRSFIAQRLGSPGDDFIGLDAGTSTTVGAFTLHGIAAAHNDLERDKQGRHKFLGYVVQCGRWTLYHSGDTLLYPGLADSLRPFHLDLALLPINGNKPERRVAGNLDGREAAQLAHDIGARWVVPCHYEMFEFNTAAPHELFIPECERLKQSYRVLRAGEGWNIEQQDPQICRPVSASTCLRQSQIGAD
jgi:L-ascorbate metabolism protein UlaG (beta-lactamase superfamily)